MRHLPDEVILQILAYLEPPELVRLQSVSHQLLRLGRDNSLWKQHCFEQSTSERRRRRLLPTDDIDASLAELVRAANQVVQLPATAPDTAAEFDDQNNGNKAQHRNLRLRAPLLASWDPTYSNERVDFHADFIQRHAPHSISWFQDVKRETGPASEELHLEATGAGILYNARGLADKLVAPLEDGSISIWDASASSNRQGRIVARSAMGLLANKGSDLDYDTRLTQSQAAMTETGAVECVSVDSRQNHAFFAVQNTLHQVDLATLQLIASTQYPFPVTALSEAWHPTPLTVGTNWTVHLHDPRQAPSSPTHLDTGDVGNHVSLAQPGALSIAHLPTAREWDANGDIWVGGRFTSFLNFDRRFFPRLHGTVHSGARVSCLAALPYPLVPHDLRSEPSRDNVSVIKHIKETSGYTLIAVGEYKGKGSLEQYSLSADPTRSINSADSRTTSNSNALYRNRQTASRSKLLSVAAHGMRIVFSDGDGEVKWMERDGVTPVRRLNINDDKVNRGSDADDDTSSGDIVQKILPTVTPSLHHQPESVALGEDELVLWTGDGRLGLLGFGRADAVDKAWLDGLIEEVDGEEGSSRAVDREKEQEYGAEMRKALEMQAREARWLRGYGL